MSEAKNRAWNNDCPRQYSAWTLDCRRASGVARALTGAYSPTTTSRGPLVTAPAASDPRQTMRSNSTLCWPLQRACRYQKIWRQSSEGEMSERKSTPRRGSLVCGQGKFIWPTIGLVLAACVTISSMQAQAQSAATVITGRATVQDGDSLRIGEHRIVLWGVDAPEGETVCGDARPDRQARAALRRIVGRRPLECEVREVDRHGRELSVCRVRGRDVGALMVEQGWARDWPRHSCGAYAGLEAGARQSHRGVWSMECPALWGTRNYSPDRCHPVTPSR